MKSQVNLEIPKKWKMDAFTAGPLHVDISLSNVQANNIDVLDNHVLNNQSSIVQADALWIALDKLWDKKDYATIVHTLSSEVSKLESQNWEQMPAAQAMDKAADLSVMEQRLRAVLNQISMVENAYLKKEALELLKNLGSHINALFYRASDLDNQALSAPVVPYAVFKNTQKKAGFHSKETQKQYYIDDIRKFISKGGSMEQVKPLSASFLQALPARQLCEFAIDEYDTARITEEIHGRPSPGHPLLAGGYSVLAAGTLIVDRNELNEITLIQVGTMSGRYRSGVGSLQHMVRHLESLGFSRDMIVVREGQAGSARIEEVLGRVMKLDDSVLEDVEKTTAQRAQAWNKPIASPAKPVTQVNIALQQQAAAAIGTPKGTFYGDLHLAFEGLSSVIGEALSDDLLGMRTLLSNGDNEFNSLDQALDKFMNLAQKYGDHAKFDHGIALIEQLINHPGCEEEARQLLIKKHELRTLQKSSSSSWGQAGIFGEGSAERVTRICATLNPDADDGLIRSMMIAGMNVVRLNTAHLENTEQGIDLMNRIRHVAQSLNKDVRIQIDLEGPKMRLGRFDNPSQAKMNDIVLNNGDVVELVSGDTLGNAKQLPVDVPGFSKSLKKGDNMLLNDGLIQLEIVEVNPVKAKVINGGVIWDHKGIHFPQTSFALDAITKEDLENLSAYLPYVDIVAPSFVNRSEDILNLRQKMVELDRIVPILAKCETPDSLKNIETIAVVSDGLMVARGDLGTLVGYENVPAAERDVLAAGKLFGKPIMVATEVLMSMVDNAVRPSRGEVDALYNAVQRGVDCIMLGKETSKPVHAAETVKAAARIMCKAEKDLEENAFVRMANRLQA
jgi:pyruvate kinase